MKQVVSCGQGVLGCGFLLLACLGLWLIGEVFSYWTAAVLLTILFGGLMFFDWLPKKLGFTWVDRHLRRLTQRKD